MSEKISLYQAIKDNWAQVAVAFVVASIFGTALMEWRIKSNIATALAAVDLATDLKIVSMDKSTASNTSGVAENKEDITVNRQNVERAFSVLMGREP